MIKALTTNLKDLITTLQTTSSAFDLEIREELSRLPGHFPLPLVRRVSLSQEAVCRRRMDLAVR
jgi:hypothetical protein